MTIDAQRDINVLNVRYIAQIEGQLSVLRQVIEDEKRAKKKWRNATLLISGANVIFLTSFVLSR